MIGPVKVLTIGVARSCVLQTPLPPQCAAECCCSPHASEYLQSGFMHKNQIDCKWETTLAKCRKTYKYETEGQLHIWNAKWQNWYVPKYRTDM